MLIKKMKNIVVCGVIALSSITLFSGCDTSKEPVNEAITVTTATEETLSDEELDVLAANMPEIVFVMSHHYDDTNILGFYITNTGEMKIYDFRNIAPDEIYEIPDVYDRLEEAVCSEIDFRLYSKDGYLFTEKDLIIVSEDELAECYKTLLQINGTAIKCDSGVRYDDPEVPTGHYRYYGAKYDDYGNIQVILIHGNGEGYSYNYNDSSINSLAGELFYRMYYEICVEFYDSLRGVIY